jgi:hypothetical protein
MGYVCYSGVKYTIGVEENLLDEGIDRYFGISQKSDVTFTNQLLSAGRLPQMSDKDAQSGP